MTDTNDQIIPSAPVATEEEMREWYQALEEQQKEDLKKRWAQLKRQEKKAVLNEYKASKNNRINISLSNPIFLTDPFFYYFMMTSPYSMANAIRHIGHLPSTLASLPAPSIPSLPNLNHLPSVNLPNTNLDEGALIAVGIGAIVAVTISAFVGITYAAKKVINSVYNLATGIKPLKSLFRLAGIGGAGYAMFFVGTAAGAAAGSFFPIVGTALGAIIGGVLFACIGAGIGALVTKYTAKGIAAAVSVATSDSERPSGSDVSLTNPSKYQISHAQLATISSECKKSGLQTSDKAIYDFMNEIRNTKNKMMASIPGTSERREKKVFNEYIKALKSGELLVDINKNVYAKNESGFTLFINGENRSAKSSLEAKPLPTYPRKK